MQSALRGRPATMRAAPLITLAAVIITDRRGPEILREDGVEFVFRIHARQVREDEDRFPLQNLVPVVKQPDKEIKMRIEQLGPALADEAEDLRAARI